MAFFLQLDTTVVVFKKGEFFMAISTEQQVPWVGDNVIGHSTDSMGEIDATEGFGAIDSLFKTQGLGSRAIDIGGGAYDANSAYMASRYLVDCVVYDPYKRHSSHNEKIIADATNRPIDAALSLSVLNVISESSCRLAHIRLCQSVLKTGGKAVFKVWPGDRSGLGTRTVSGYQSNRDIDTYIEELQTVFGSHSVFYHSKEKTVRCTNLVVRHLRGSLSI